MNNIKDFNLEDIGKIVEEIDLADLINKEPCYFCVAFGIPIQYALHHQDEMEGGPITSDRKCLHCYDTEVEFGRLRLTKEEKEYASSTLKEFEKCKEQRLYVK